MSTLTQEAITRWEREDEIADIHAVLADAADRSWCDRVVDDPDDDNGDDMHEAVMYHQLSVNV